MLGPRVMWLIPFCVIDPVLCDGSCFMLLILFNEVDPDLCDWCDFMWWIQFCVIDVMLCGWSSFMWLMQFYVVDPVLCSWSSILYFYTWYRLFMGPNSWIKSLNPSHKLESPSLLDSFLKKCELFYLICILSFCRTMAGSWACRSLTGCRTKIFQPKVFSLRTLLRRFEVAATWRFCPPTCAQDSSDIFIW